MVQCWSVCSSCNLAEVVHQSLNCPPGAPTIEHMNIQTVKDFFHNIKNDREFHNKALPKFRIRVPRTIAREMLLNNESTTIDGKVMWFGIRHLGLDIYEIRLLDDIKTTCMID